MKTHVSNCWISELPKSERKKNPEQTLQFKKGIRNMKQT